MVCKYEMNNLVQQQRRHTLRSRHPAFPAPFLQNAPHLGAHMEIVHSLGSHECQLHVSVRVDATRDDQLVGGIDHSDPRRDRKVRSDIDDFSILDVDVADHRALLVDDPAAPDQDPDGLCHTC